uniref:Secreted protein n=1 Tax=Oryza brachyantha TaxID=4533 RepID=J3MVM9_ORYBR
MEFLNLRDTFLLIFSFAKMALGSLGETTCFSNKMSVSSIRSLILSDSSNAVILFGSKLSTFCTSSQARSSLSNASKHRDLFNNAFVYFGDASNARLH